MVLRDPSAHGCIIALCEEMLQKQNSFIIVPAVSRPDFPKSSDRSACGITCMMVIRHTALNKL